MLLMLKVATFSGFLSIPVRITLIENARLGLGESALTLLTRLA